MLTLLIVATMNPAEQFVLYRGFRSVAHKLADGVALVEDHRYNANIPLVEGLEVLHACIREVRTLFPVLEAFSKRIAAGGSDPATGAELSSACSRLRMLSCARIPPVT